MLEPLKNFGRAIIPKSLFKLAQPPYHYMMAKLATWYYGNPSRSLYVIGITGTAGKSTTVMMLAHILGHAGKKTGYTTTVGHSDGTHSHLNKHGLSMPGGWLLQRQLREMVDNHCQYAIVECTSEGLAQNRHAGIIFQAALFTNLSPAHLDNHGSFENYRAAKERLFSALGRNQTGVTILGVNADDPNYNYFSGFSAKRKFGVSMRTDRTPTAEFPITVAKNIVVQNNITFEIDSTQFTLNLFGTFNVTNALLAIEMAHQIGVPLEESSAALARFNKVPGRMEVIPNTKGFTVIVDYAPEPADMRAALSAINAMPHHKIIHVFGSPGGHRDVSKRFELGKISAEFSDTIIITNDDVYNNDPEEIAANIQIGIEQAENKKTTRVEKVLDRKEAIKFMLSIAEPQDIIIITGKGSEQFLILPDNHRIAWDDREIVKNFLQ